MCVCVTPRTRHQQTIKKHSRCSGNLKTKHLKSKTNVIYCDVHDKHDRQYDSIFLLLWKGMTACRRDKRYSLACLTLFRPSCPLSDRLVRSSSFVEHAACGLRHLHAQLGISHNDVKPGNILIGLDDPAKGYIGKMADFGNCRGEREHVLCSTAASCY